MPVALAAPRCTAAARRSALTGRCVRATRPAAASLDGNALAWLAKRTAITLLIASAGGRRSRTCRCGVGAAAPLTMRVGAAVMPPLQPAVAAGSAPSNVRDQTTWPVSLSSM